MLDYTFSPDRLVDASELADRVGVTTETVLDWCRRYPDAPYIRVGNSGHYRFDAANFIAWMERQTPRRDP